MDPESTPHLCESLGDGIAPAELKWREKMKRFEEFFHGIYGFDTFSYGLLLFSVILNLVMGLVPSEAVNQYHLISFLPLVYCAFRVFSHNGEKRSRENQRFQACLRPLFEAMDEHQEERKQAKLFKFFKCPVCRQKLRVPKGKGKVEITCPNCGNKFIKKA